MELLPSRGPEPRLLSTAARVLPRPLGEIEDKKGRSKLQRESFFTGNGRAIFVGIGVGSALLGGGGWLFERHHHLKPDELHVPKIIAVATGSLADSPESAATARSVAVQVHPELLHVTAIVLGHPRLAVINGHSVAEGESLTLHAPNMSMAVTLRVVKISDGYIELTHGGQTIVARLNIPALAPVANAPKSK